MDGGDPGRLPDGAARETDEEFEARAAPAAHESPVVSVEGYEGPLDHMLDMVRTNRIDLLRLPVAEVIEQLVAAIVDAGGRADVTARAGWLVQAATVLQLWSRLRFAATEEDRAGAEADARRLRRELADRALATGLATWLGSRPQLGIDSFACGNPGWDAAAGDAPEPDRAAFLVALVRMLDADLPKREPEIRYRPAPLPPHDPAEAMRRISDWLAREPAGRTPLEGLLPPGIEREDARGRRSGWASTFLGGLELCRQQRLSLDQDEAFGEITASAAEPPGDGREREG